MAKQIDYKISSETLNDKGEKVFTLIFYIGNYSAKNETDKDGNVISVTRYRRVTVAGYKTIVIPNAESYTRNEITALFNKELNKISFSRGISKITEQRTLYKSNPKAEVQAQDIFI